MDQTISSNIPNFTLLCRLCLCEENYMFPIFNESNIYLPQRIAACVNVEVYKSDSISTLICKQCLNKINDWHEFKKYCNDSQTKLRYWSNTSVSNDPLYYKNEIKEEANNYDDETIISGYLEDIKLEPLEISYEEFSNNEESDSVSTTMYFLPDENSEFEQDSEALLVPTYELSPDEHGLTGPLKQQASNGIENLQISQVYQVVSCRICDTNFSSIANRARHEKVKHMVNFKDIKCFLCDTIWNEEDELLDHFKLNHLASNQSNFDNSGNIIIKNGYTFNTFEKSHEYLKQFAENLILLRNQFSGAKQVSLKSFIYYNQCIQKMIDRNSTDLNTSLKNVLEYLFNQNLVIKNSCHQCCISFKSLTEFKQHISKRYCRKRVRLVESGQIEPNQHLKCARCDRLFGCKILLTHHIKSEHLDLDNAPENCNICMKSFQNKHEYYAHIQETCSYQIYCSICELLFDTTDDFKLHSKVHNDSESNLVEQKQAIYNKKSRKYWKNKCCLCGKFFRHFEALEKHFKSVHFEFKLKICKYCGDNFTSEEDRDAHISNVHFVKNVQSSNDDFHHRSQIYLCIQCNLVFSTIEDLEQHKTIHINSDYNNSIPDPLDSPLFTCIICLETFNFEEELNQHMNTNHDNKKKEPLTIQQIKVKCTICRNTFSNNKALVVHNVRMHSKIKKKGISCLKCHKTVKDMKIHLKKNHCIPPKNKAIKNAKKKLLKIKKKVDGDDTYACIVCKKIFSRKKSLFCHAKTHYQINKWHKPLCQVCGKTCKNVEDLLNHFKSHSSKLLNNLRNMKSPLKTSQDKSAVSSDHKCNICPKKFATKGGLKRHFDQQHHKSDIPLKCIICKAQFNIENDLISHVQAHVDNNNKFKCKNCNKLFVYETYTAHMSTVHGSHTCVLCNKMFFTYSSLVSHRGWHYR